LTRGRVCNLLVQLLLGLARALTLGSKVCTTRDHISLLHLRLPNMEGQIPVFMFPRNRVAQLYPWALGCLFVFSYDSHGYGGGILISLHRPIEMHGNWSALNILDTHSARNTSPEMFISWLGVAIGTHLVANTVFNVYSIVVRYTVVTASSPALNTRALTLVPICAFFLFFSFP
jgi:hypothetical protein